MNWRNRAPALGLAMLFQLAALWAFIHALIVPAPERVSASRETQVLLLPAALAPPGTIRKRQRRAQSGASTAITPYVDPDTFNLQSLTRPNTQTLASALSSCDPGKYDMAADEVKALCDRIGALIKRDPGRFGFTSDVEDPRHWQRELARREAPVLAPCMSPGGVDVLYTLTCIYEEIFTGHREDKRRRYSE